MIKQIKVGGKEIGFDIVKSGLRLFIDELTGMWEVKFVELSVDDVYIVTKLAAFADRWNAVNFMESERKNYEPQPIKLVPAEGQSPTGPVNPAD